jgi:hypothetical protein
MEQVFIKVAVQEEDEVIQWQVPKKTVEIKRYSGLNGDLGKGRIVESRLYECIRSCPPIVIGCYSVKIMPKKDCQLWLQYNKGQLIVLFLTDKTKQLVGDLDKNFLVNIVETDKVRIEVELC